jgi:hypothetical protein
LAIAAVAAFAVPSAHAQSGATRAKVLETVAYALGMARWAEIGAPNVRLPAIDVVNTMEIVGSGTVDVAGRPVKTEYLVDLGYNPAAMRVEMTRPGPTGAPQHTIQTVRQDHAWDESELGAGLIAGKGTATPMPAALRERFLQLWTLPYGVVKGAIAAGDKTIVSTEAGATVITFPLAGQLAGITVKATLDSKNLVARVETRSDHPALASLVTETVYTDYADRAEVLTDIKTPGRIVRTQGGRTMLDIVVKSWETNNQYLVFPVPPNVKAAGPATSR